MASHEHHDHATVHVLPKDKEKIARIWKTAGVLAFVTGVEFILAFTVNRGVALTSLFVLLTFVKTFYIVGEFMHLKYEVKTLIWFVFTPILFVIWLITAMLMEGTSFFHLKQWIWG